MKIDGSLAQNVDFAVGPLKKKNLVGKRCFLTLRRVEVAVPMGKVAQACLFRRLTRCVAGVALCDIPHVLGAQPS